MVANGDRNRKQNVLGKFEVNKIIFQFIKYALQLMFVNYLRFYAYNLKCGIGF